jgi:putative nucleotidyltransferase with HDIG domain
MKENLPLTRDEAFALVKKYNSDARDIIHYLESEAVLRAIARRIGEDEDYYGMLGLLHDIDWGITKENPVTHLTEAPRILHEAGFDEVFIQIILSHGYGCDCAGLLDKKRTEKIEYALAAGETITGLIHAYALMRGKKISDMDTKGLMKKYKDKRFAEGCDRNIIVEIEHCGIPLEEFFGVAIDGIKRIKNEVGLE